MDRSAALDAAKRAVADRPNSYGNPEQNFWRIAALWNSHFDNLDFDLPQPHGELTATDVAIMLALVKIARLEADPSHADSWIDMAGYAACGAEVSGAADTSEKMTWQDHWRIANELRAKKAEKDKPAQGCPLGIVDCPDCYPKRADKPAQNSDLVDDVLKQAADARRWSQAMGYGLGLGWRFL